MILKLHYIILYKLSKTAVLVSWSCFKSLFQKTFAAAHWTEHFYWSHLLTENSEPNDSFLTNFGVYLFMVMFLTYIVIETLTSFSINIFIAADWLKVHLDWTRSNAKQREAKVGDLRQPSQVVANLRDRSLHRLILITYF